LRFLTQVNVLRASAPIKGQDREGLMPVDDRSYHLERVRSELDIAYHAEAERVADAHLRLSALHIQRLRDLDDDCGGAGIGG